ncbi:hypothetical protein CRM22_004756 [Opisthorchis felineus]|uniref:Uncharacterized protein n=1 Tax=Opisthorchis felineus TaxID=147828 RepID=A0A4V3SF88_OPIFE|nr:hypothetical protein CRM22_004756 [Opisthorchis felineus]
MHLRQLDEFRYTFCFIIWSLACSSLHGAPLCVTPLTTPVTPTTTPSMPHTTTVHSTCQTKPLIDNTLLTQTSDARSESSESKTGTTVNLTQTPVHTSTVMKNNHSDSSTVLSNTPHPVSLSGKAKDFGHFARGTVGCAVAHKKTNKHDFNTKISKKSAAGITTLKETRVSLKARETGTAKNADSKQLVDEILFENWQPTQKLFINDSLIRRKRQKRSVEPKDENLDQAHDLSFVFFDDPRATSTLNSEHLHAQQTEKQPVKHNDVEVTNSTDKNQQVTNANPQGRRPLLSESYVGLGKEEETAQKISKSSNTNESLKLATKKTDFGPDTSLSIPKTDFRNEELLQTVEKITNENLGQTPKKIISRINEHHMQDSNPLSLVGKKLTETADQVSDSSTELILNFSNVGSTGKEPATKMPIEWISITGSNEQPPKSDHLFDEGDSTEAITVPTQDSQTQRVEDEGADSAVNQTLVVLTGKLHNSTTKAPDNESGILIAGSELPTVANEMLKQTNRTRMESSDRVPTDIPMDLNNLGEREFSSFQYTSTEVVDMAYTYNIPPPIIDSLPQSTEYSLELATSTESQIVSAENIKVLEPNSTTGGTFGSMDKSEPGVTVKLPEPKTGAENEMGHSSDQNDIERTAVGEKTATNKSNTLDSQEAIVGIGDNESPLPSHVNDLGKRTEKINVCSNEDCQTRGHVEDLEPDKSNKAERSMDSLGDNEKVTSVTHLRPNLESVAIYNEPTSESYLELDPDLPLHRGVEDSHLSDSSTATASLAYLTEMPCASDRREDLYEIESHAVISHTPTEKQGESGMHAISVGLVSDSVLTLPHQNTLSTDDPSMLLITVHNTDSVIQTKPSGPQSAGSTSSLGEQVNQPQTSASLDSPEQPGSGHSTTFVTEHPPAVSSKPEKAVFDLQNFESSSHHYVDTTNRVNISDGVLPTSDRKSELVRHAQHNQTGSEELNATTIDSADKTSKTASSGQASEVAGLDITESVSSNDPNSVNRSYFKEFTSSIDIEANMTLPVQLTFPPPALDDISSGSPWSDNNSLSFLPPTQSEHLAKSGSDDHSDTASSFPMSSRANNDITQNDGFVPQPRSGKFHLPGSNEKDSAPPSSLTFTTWFFTTVIICLCSLS